MKDINLAFVNMIYPATIWLKIIKFPFFDLEDIAARNKK